MYTLNFILFLNVIYSVFLVNTFDIVEIDKKKKTKKKKHHP